MASGAMLSVLNVLFGSAALFFSYRLILSDLGARQLGIWAIASSTLTALRMTDFGLAAGTTRFVASRLARGRSSQAGRLIQTSIFSVFLLGLLLVIGLYPPALMLIDYLDDRTAGPAISGMLPWLFISLLAGLLSNVIAGCLDGCQRIDRRNISAMLGTTSFCLGVFFLVPTTGVRGVAIAQFLQVFVSSISGWLFLRAELPTLPALPVKLDRKIFVALFRYGAVFQASNLLVLVVDPALKFLVAHYGGLSATGVFDMAMQFVQRVRQIVIAGVQTLAPASAYAIEVDPAALPRLYARTYRLVFIITLLIYPLLILAVPSVSLLWLRDINETFLLVSYIGACGLAINTLSSPAYFCNIGSGHVGVNSLSLAVTAVGTILGGWLGGSVFGAVGVATGYMSAVVVSALLVHLTFNVRQRIPLAKIIPVDCRLSSLICTAGFIAAWAYLLLCVNGVPLGEPLKAVLNLAVAPLLFLGIFAIAFRSQLRALLASRFTMA